MAANTAKPNECPVCLEEINCMKQLQCCHRFCSACVATLATNMEEGRKTICCPTCRQNSNFFSVEHLPTYYFGHLQCDICLKEKEVDDFWWCRSCVQLICSKCHVKRHNFPDHQPVEWDSFQAVKDIWQISKRQENTAPASVALSDRRKVRRFLKEIEEALLSKLQQAQPLPKQAFYYWLDQFYGEFDTTDTGTLQENAERAGKVADQMVRLAIGDDSKGIWSEYSRPSALGTELYRGIEKINRSAESIAEEIWSSVTLHPEQERSKHPPVIVESNYSGLKKALILNDEILDSASANHVFSDEESKVNYWEYRGNGEFLQKFLDVKSLQCQESRPNILIIEADDEWVPTSLSLDTISYVCDFSLHVKQKLSVESQSNLLKSVSGLFKKFSGLTIFDFYAYGNEVGELEAIWDHLPDHLERLLLSRVPLSNGGVEVLMRALSRLSNFYMLWIFYDESSWQSLLSVMCEVNKLRKVDAIGISDGFPGGNSEVFGKFLGEIGAWQEECHLMLFCFNMSGEHVEELSKAIPVLKGKIKGICLDTIAIEDGHFEMLKAMYPKILKI